MANKEIAAREGAARTVGSLVPAQKAKMTAGLAATWGGSAAQWEAAVGFIVESVLRRTSDSVKALLQASEAHELELGDDPAIRNQRDAAQAALFTAIVDLRNVAYALYGDAGIRVLRLEGATPEQPDLLLDTARNAVAALERPGSLPAPRVDVSWDPAKPAAQIAGLAQTLSQALEAVARERREAATTLAAKDNAVATHDTTFGRGARLLEALFVAAGELDLAAQVRPSQRRPGRLVAQEQAEAPSAEE